jgi:hypothetical protein
VRDGHHRGRGHSAGRGGRPGLRGLDIGGVGWNFGRGSGRRRVRRGDSYRLDGSAFRDRRQRQGDMSVRRLDARSRGLRGRSSPGRWARQMSRWVQWASLAIAAAQSLTTTWSRGNRRRELYGERPAIPARSTVRALLPSAADDTSRSRRRAPEGCPAWRACEFTSPRE